MSSSRSISQDLLIASGLLFADEQLTPHKSRRQSFCRSLDHTTTMAIIYNALAIFIFISSAFALSLSPIIQNYPIITTGVYTKIETRVYQDTSNSDIYWICSAFLSSTGSVTIEKRRFWVGVDINGLGIVESITQPPNNKTYIDIDVVDSTSDCQFGLLTAAEYLVGPPFISVANIGMKQIEVTTNDTVNILPFFLSTTSFIPPSPPFNSSQYLGYINSMDSSSYPPNNQIVSVASKGAASSILLVSSTGTSFSSLNEGLNPSVIVWPDQALLTVNSGIFCFRENGGSEVFTRTGTSSNQYSYPVLSRLNDTTGSMSVLKTTSLGVGYEVVIIDKLGNAATDLSLTKTGPTSVTHTSLNSYLFILYQNNSKIYADVLFYNSTIDPPPVPVSPPVDPPIIATPTTAPVSTTPNTTPVVSPLSVPSTSSPISAPVSTPTGVPVSVPSSGSPAPINTPVQSSAPVEVQTPTSGSEAPIISDNTAPSSVKYDTPMASNDTLGVTTSPADPISASVLGPAIAVPVAVAGVGAFLLAFFLKKRNQNKKQKKNEEDKPTPSSDVLPLTDRDNKSGSGGSYASLPLDKDATQLTNPIEGKESKYRPMSGAFTSPLNLTEPGSKLLSMKAIQPADVDKRMYIPYQSLSFTREIGSGSYGKVFLGEWRGAQVAIKVNNSYADNEGFISEAKLTLGITPHPNLVQTFGVSIDGPNTCIVLEYCGGGSLDKLVFDKRDLVTHAQRKEFALKIAYGLLHLHNNNIVHRDLAARNILLTNDNQPKISDFGMSRIVRDQASKGKTKTAFGPIRWMAPESLKDRTYSTKSDVWSYGILLWELVAGSEPHEEEDQLNIAIKIRDQGFVPTIPDTCDAALRHVMEMCWKMSPADRPSMEEVANYLRTH